MMVLPSARVTTLASLKASAPPLPEAAWELTRELPPAITTCDAFFKNMAPPPPSSGHELDPSSPADELIMALPPESVTLDSSTHIAPPRSAAEWTIEHCPVNVTILCSAMYKAPPLPPPPCPKVPGLPSELTIVVPSSISTLLVRTAMAPPLPWALYRTIPCGMVASSALPLISFSKRSRRRAPPDTRNTRDRCWASSVAPSLCEKSCRLIEATSIDTPSSKNSLPGGKKSEALPPNGTAATAVRNSAVEVTVATPGANGGIDGGNGGAGGGGGKDGCGLVKGRSGSGGDDGGATGGIGGGEQCGTATPAFLQVVGQSWLIVAVLVAGGVNGVLHRLTLATNAAHSATIFWHAAVTLPNSLTGSDEGLRTLAHVSVLRGM
mmetsp:Transcript_86054/g.257922  ORF Transcript_86054/g.257922 Transcript_86054/m.257922 type:complete len:380 (+) Transcript_86054:2092-3231(+)